MATDECPAAVVVATPFGFVRVVETITMEVDRATDGEAAPVVAIACEFEVVAEMENISTSV
jgi:hypothetical protein